jgi:RNA polymerase sigma-70 factor (sigma-E family)
VTFEEFAAARQGGLLRVAFVLTADRHLAEDLVQTVLTSVWLRWPRIKGLANRDAYVQKMLITQYVTWRRRRWWSEAPTADLPDRAGAAANPDVDLARALLSLPRRQRAVIVLRYLQDLTELETARVLGCSVGTVKSQTAKALTVLRRSAALRDTADLPDLTGLTDLTADKEGG